MRTRIRVSARTARWGRRVLFCLLLVPLLDGTYGVVTGLRYTAWERAQTWDAEGVAAFARAFEAGEGREAVLLVHGFGDSAGVWTRMVPALVARGFHCQAIRLKGWGEAPPAKRLVTVSHWEQQVNEALARLRGTHERVWVIAHSMGGCLVYNLAADGRLEAVDGLVLLAPMLQISERRSPLLSARTWYELGRGLVHLTPLFESFFPDDTLRQPPRPRTERDPFVTRNIYDLLFAEMDRAALVRPYVSLPIWGVLAEEDRVVDSPAVRAQLVRTLRGEAIVDVLPGHGHTLPQDMDCTVFAERFQQWTQQHGDDDDR